ncbi:SDR family oxidoreductase [Lysobacter sp. LF1]|uniref:SDR family oxidoreductase n=1 Tax=Lysobacter stagni TaxID=3045172 RepID=A0ABT6XEB3_9GAMM|nr:SDR family oxidoreductase [Lysobacter sp. LF1]MDI9238481.1 SDR family oxidoreductase [Lysobacter sp. LF1]
MEEMREAGQGRTVLVLGAGGFIAGFIIAALRTHGWRVIRGVRRPERDGDTRICDLSDDTTDWRAVVAGVDVVVNAAGILRESGQQRFEAIHDGAPFALAQACVDLGVRRFVQVSALGRPEDGEFVASKHRFDEALLRLPLSAVVLRPSVVYSTRGSYGGTSLLRAMAALPGVLALPGRGDWPLQPLSAEDLGELVARAATGSATGVFEVAGPAPVMLGEYLHRWRHWLRVGPAVTLQVPVWLVSAAAWLGERCGVGPLGETMWKMLQRGNVASSDASVRLHEAFGMVPRALDDVLVSEPSQVQDRWHARLYWLGPLLRVAVAALFLLSAFSGLLAPVATIESLVRDSVLSAWHPVAMARLAAVLDLALGAWLLTGRAPRIATASMIVPVLVYTLVFGSLLPQSWLEPLGGMAKNLVVLPALAVLWVLGDRR